MKKIITVLTLLVSVLSLSACNKKEESPVVDTPVVNIPTEVPTQPETDVEVPSQTPDESEITTEDTTVEEVKVYVAKTYKQVYPDLYNFYPENPPYTYSKWIYTIDGDSDFIGSITTSDGTVIIGEGKVEFEVPVDKEGYEGTPTGAPTQTPNTGDTGNTGNTSGDNSGGSTTPILPGVVIGDPTVNPNGEDVVLSGTNGDVVTVTTKTIEDAVIDEFRTTPYTLVYDVKKVNYILANYTVEGAKEVLASNKLYEGVAGVVKKNDKATVQTMKGVYESYSLVDDKGNTYAYAATYTPLLAPNTIYVLYNNDISKNVDLMTQLQLLVVE